MRLRKSSLITKLVILALMVYAVATIMTLQPQINALNAEREKLSAEVADVEQENLELQEDIAAMDTDEAVIEIARERLNLVEDGEMVFIDSGNGYGGQRGIYGIFCRRSTGRQGQVNHKIRRVYFAPGKPHRDGAHFRDCQYIRQ